jgi:hypothetical protein
MSIETNSKCPQCSDDLIFPRGETPYCENCGWPDENRPEITIEEMSDVELREALAAAKEQLAKAITALEEIKEGKGEYNREPLIHARNTIESMKALASTTLAELKGQA